MRKSSIFLGLFAAAVSASTTAQLGPRDGTSNVKSESLGAPGQPVDPMTGYLQQKSLNNLPGQQSAVTNDRLGPARPAKAAELVAGVTVNDKAGVAVGKIESIDSDGVVVATATGKVKIPADAFGHNKAGLLLDTLKAQFDQIVAKANSSPNG